MRPSAGRGSDVEEDRQGKMKAAPRGRREGVSQSGLKRPSAVSLKCRGGVIWSGFKDKVLLVFFSLDVLDMM